MFVMPLPKRKPDLRLRLFIRNAMSAARDGEGKCWAGSSDRADSTQWRRQFDVSLIWPRKPSCQDSIAESILYSGL